MKTKTERLNQIGFDIEKFGFAVFITLLGDGFPANEVHQIRDHLLSKFEQLSTAPTKDFVLERTKAAFADKAEKINVEKQEKKPIAH